MTIEQAYRKAREPDTGSWPSTPYLPDMPTPAQHALRLARWKEGPVDWHGLTPTGRVPGESEPIATGIVDGFTVTITTDSDFDVPMDWVGTFTPARDRYGERVPRPDPSAILWTNKGTWRLERGEHWYTPTDPIEETVRYYAKRGASRGMAREYALAMMRRRADQDAEALERGEYLVTATASKAGVELGQDNLGAVGLSDDWERDLSEFLPDLIGQAIEEARATLESLCE